jgi:hypothetical protein
MTMKRSFSQLIASTSLLMLATGATAGVLDSPLPTLAGQKSSLAFTAAGVINAAGLATLFSCTNSSSDPVVASVELFVDAGGDACNDANAVAVSLAAGQSVMFSTQNNVESSFFSTRPLTSVPMFLSLGSARIVATGKGLLCTAMIADMFNSPPQSMASIVLAARGKQK